MLQAVAGEAALDVVAFETVPCLKELRAISRLMRTEFPSTSAWVSCSCRDAGHIAHGESLAGAQSYHSASVICLKMLDCCQSFHIPGIWRCQRSLTHIALACSGQIHWSNSLVNVTSLLWSDLHCLIAEECIPVLLEADSVVALGVNCILPALVAPALQVHLPSFGNL